MEIIKDLMMIDEFQEFRNINPAIYSEMQNLWDKHKNNSKSYSLWVGLFVDETDF
jgi:hypothetical protein